jgi:hypothetical protein
MVGMILGIVALHDSEQEAPMRQKMFFLSLVYGAFIIHLFMSFFY